MLDLTLKTQVLTRLRLLDDFEPTALLTRQSSHRGQPEIMNNKHWPNRTPNSVLAEEVEVIDAISGQDTLQITSSNRMSTAAELSFEHKPSSFLLSCPSDYPQSPPSITGIDPLWLSITETAKEHLAAIRSFIKCNFVAGELCVFDLIEYVRGTVSWLEKRKEHSERRLDSEKLELVDIEAMQTHEACAACLDDFYCIDVVKLTCKHSYCTDCLQRE